MPRQGDVISKLPRSFEGKWIQVYFDKHSVAAHIFEVEKISDDHCLIYMVENEYIDSSHWAKLDLGEIDTVLLNGNRLDISGTTSKMQFALNDTLTSSKRKIEFDINLGEKYFNYNWGKGPIDEKERKECVLKFFKGAYFLNVKRGDNWLVTKIDLKKKQLFYTTTTFYNEEEGKLFKDMLGKYGIKKHRPSGNVGAAYFVDVSDEEFEEIMNRKDIFGVVHWQKVENYTLLTVVLLFIGIFVAAIIVFYYKSI